VIAKVRQKPAQFGLLIFSLLWMLVILPLTAMATPYAALVIDARSGEVLHETNADARLHPASLTKMMTLYIAFQAVERGEISLDTPVRISANAAAEPPSKLGLKAGQTIKLRFLIRAAAVKSANDAATAIGEAISGSEAAFAARMTRTARAMGMTKTTFKNAHGLTAEGHMSSARDMTILGRHLIYDYPAYYSIFQRRTADAGIGTVSNTNRRLLDNYAGADGVKTGYTRAAGYNLVASAERGNQRIIATVFGGRSGASRNAKVAELLDIGFKRAPGKAPFEKPKAPSAALVAQADVEDAPAARPAAGAKGKTIRLSGAVKSSLRPQNRPGAAPSPVQLALQDDIQKALAEAVSAGEPPKDAVVDAAAVEIAVATNGQPPERPAEAATVQTAVVRPPQIIAALAAAVTAPTTDVAASAPVAPPMARPASQATQAAIQVAVAPAPAKIRPRTPPQPAVQETVSRVSTSGGRHWGITVGKFPNRFLAERAVLKTALMESASLDGSLRKVVERKSGFEAAFLGMTREGADLACRRLQARKQTCFMIGPG
jgi:D-alanyl-D-alanine carboxypeptidase